MICGMVDQIQLVVFWWWDLCHLIINTIDFVTIASTGNATDFGDLTLQQDLRWWNFLIQ